MDSQFLLGAICVLLISAAIMWSDREMHFFSTEYSHFSKMLVKILRYPGLGNLKCYIVGLQETQASPAAYNIALKGLSTNTQASNQKCLQMKATFAVFKTCIVSYTALQSLSFLCVCVDIHSSASLLGTAS